MGYLCGSSDKKRTSLELPVDFSSVWEGREGERGDAVCMASSALQSLWQGLAVQRSAAGEPGLCWLPLWLRALSASGSKQKPSSLCSGGVGICLGDVNQI